MIAYKVFNFKESKLYPVFMRKLIARDFAAYNPEYITLRANNCGPFACFSSLGAAKDFAAAMNYRPFINKVVIHKVEISKSIDTSLWVDSRNMIGVHELPNGTILADEFEILECVK